MDKITSEMLNQDYCMGRVCFDNALEGDEADMKKVYDVMFKKDGGTWNGWACPYFDEYERDRFIKDCEADPNQDEENLADFKAIEPAFQVGTLNFYYFGSCWCWNDVTDWRYFINENIDGEQWGHAFNYGSFNLFGAAQNEVERIKSEVEDVELSIQFEGPDFFEGFDEDDLNGIVPTDGKGGFPLRV